MAGRKVVLQMGLLPIPVRLEKATEDEDSQTKTVCTGTEEKPHPAERVNSKYLCPVVDCGRTASSWHGFEKGVPRPDGTFEVLSTEALTEANAPVKEMVLAFRSREKVFGSTVAGKSVNNVIPDKGGERGYTALREGLRLRPDKVAVTIWAYTHKNHLWVLELVDNRLVASQRSWPEDVRPAPMIPDASVNDQEQAFVLGMIDADTDDFDPLQYRDVARERRQELIAAATGGEGAAFPPPPKATPSSGDMLAALAAQVSVDTDTKVKSVPTKKAPARKRTAKKAAKKPAPKGSAA